MFGAFRCSKDAPDNLEYVDLSGNSSVDARNYTVLACDQCRDRKLKCSGDLNGCQRCQAARSTCTYRSSARSMDASSSKRRQSALDLTPSSKPPAKKPQTKSNADCRPTTEEVVSTQTDMGRSFSSADLKDGFWTPITMSGTNFSEHLYDWDDVHSKEHQGLDLNLGESVTVLPVVSELENTPPPYWALAAVSHGDENDMTDPILTPPPTANPIITSVASSEYRRCHCDCIRSLADTLEKISGEGASDTDEPNHFDNMLCHLRDGIETCKQVLPCNYCSVCTTNSMFVVTILQQLATTSQDLCRQLLTCQQKAKATAVGDGPLLLRSVDVYVGKYQVRSATLSLEFIFAIVSMHLKDLHRLLGHVRNAIKRGTRAFKLLTDVADIAKKASSDLQKIVDRATVCT